jgi:phosphotransferase system  glucose/maltose/N-acetylglucosamine-specific IIC component
MGLFQSSLCQINENVSNATIVIVFIISFFIFRFIANKNDKRMEEEKQERIKQAEEYFNSHLAETSEFFK